MKKLSVLTLAPAALFVGGAAMAAPIGGYDAWTVNAGVITATCPAGHTCTNLDATGNGILQQKMVDNADTTVSYFRTIVTEEGANASDLASVQALGFRIEGQIGIDGGGGNNYTNRSVIKAGAQLGNDQMSTMAEISQGALLSGSLSHFVADQEQGLGATTRGMDWHFHENGVSYLELNAYSTGGVAGGATGNEGTITVRRSGNVSLGGTLTLDPGGSQEQTLAYAAGNSVTAVWMTQAASGVLPFDQRTLGLQRYTVVTLAGQAGKTNAGGTSVEVMNDELEDGTFPITLNGPGTEISGTQWGWNTSLFGTRPQQYFENSISTGLIAPPTGTYANDFVIP